MKYIAIGPFCYGIDEDKGKAIRRARSACPTYILAKDKRANMEYDLYETDDEAYVDQQGNIVAINQPRKLREVRMVGDQRIIKEKFNDQPLP